MQCAIFEIISKISACFTLDTIVRGISLHVLSDIWESAFVNENLAGASIQAYLSISCRNARNRAHSKAAKERKISENDARKRDEAPFGSYFHILFSWNLLWRIIFESVSSKFSGKTELKVLEA